MQINSLTLNNDTDEVTLNGQPLAREYVETILLPLMILECGKNETRQARVLAAFDEAGLSLDEVPSAARAWRYSVRVAEEERQRAAEAYRRNQEIMRPKSEREKAQKAKDQAERDAKIAEHFAEVAAASRGSSSW
jgi:hypothetical protein